MKRVKDYLAAFIESSPTILKNNIRMIELNRRLRWFLLLRFGAVACLLLLLIIERFVIPEIDVKPLVLIAAAVALFILNIGYWHHHRGLERLSDPKRYSKGLTLNIQAQMVLDFAVLGCLAYLFGGLESPLIYLFLVHIILACLFFKITISFLYMLVSIIIITFISFGLYFHLMPPCHFMEGEVLGNLYQYPVYYFGYYGGIVLIYIIIWYVVASITNDLKEQECALQDQIEEMTRVDEEKTRYMLTTTHELKAPFAAIQSYVNLALGGYAGEVVGSVRDIMLKIKDRCDHLMNMIADMLRLSNLKSLKDKPIVKTEVNLSEAIIKALRIFEDRAKEKKLTFEPLNLDWASFKIVANREQIEILFANIFSNAVNYAYPQTPIRISIGERDDKIVVMVEDRGIGIRKEILPKVFLEYFRSEEAVRINKNSTGLGLATAKQIMDINNGRIWIESEVGKGTKVFLEFSACQTQL